MKTKLFAKEFLYFIKEIVPILTFSFLAIGQADAQDIIVRRTGDTIFCKITKIDTTSIMFDIKKNEKIISTSLPKEEIADYKYQYQFTSSSKYKLDTLRSVGMVVIYKKNGKPYKLLKDEKDVKIYELDQLLKSDKVSYSMLLQARKQRKTSLFLAQVGGGCIGVGVAELIMEEDWRVGAGLIGVGLVCVGIALPIASKSSVNTINAVKEYNNKLKTASMFTKGRGMYFSFNNNGIGLTYKF